MFHQVFETGQPGEIDDYEILRKSGEKRILELSVNLLQDPSGNPGGFRGMVRDVTDRLEAEKERQQLEKQFQQAQKMEAIGTLAGGIAHDFNNLLMGIQGRISLMLTNTEPTHLHFEHIKGIESYVKSATELTRQLLGMARSRKFEVQSVNLNRLVGVQNQMFGRTRKEIHIHENFQKELWYVEADSGQIEQVLLNIYVNAWHAMPGGGDLFVQTANVLIEEDDPRCRQARPGRYVRISVMDTGVGMDEATRERIFDPFFTTRELGRGTGLGLASVYGIIKNHEGFVEVSSEKGRGATFDIYLPSSDKKSAPVKTEIEDVLRGSETVLLVDDEEIILDVNQQILEYLGYQVVKARSGKQALEIYENHTERIDLVLLDMIMAGMGGRETYERLRQQDPHIKVLLSSGYSKEGDAEELLSQGCAGFIQKPFDIKELSFKLREILDG
jgi:signal transduction histidine kinase/CheY-like chemotaxis protein